MQSGHEGQLRFARGSASASELRAVIADTLAQLEQSSTFAGTTATVTEDGQGSDPATIAIVVGIVTGGGTHVVSQVWDDLLWPRIKRKLGADAVGERLDP